MSYSGGPIKRMLLAYAVEYTDGTIRYNAVLECADMTINTNYRPHGSLWGGSLFQYGRPLVEIKATGYPVVNMPQGWQRTQEDEPLQLPPAQDKLPRVTVEEVKP